VTTSVVVVSYRPGQWLAPCLASVADQADEVVLVDNGSEGAAASVIGRRAGVMVVRSPVNHGFAPGVNLGARAATGDILALLNDDAIARPGWLAAARTALADPSVAAVGPKVVLARGYREVVLADDEWQAPGDSRPLGRQVRSVRVNGSEVLEKAAGPGLHRLETDGRGDRWRWTAGARPWYLAVPDGDGVHLEVQVDGQDAPAGPIVRLVNTSGAFLDQRGYAGDIGADAPDDGRFDEPGERFALSGVAFVTTMGTWHRLGPFAAPYFAYYEDIDWCWRAQLAGLRLLYDPAATVEHRRSASSGGEHEPRVRVMAERNRTLTLVRNGPSGRAWRGLRDRAQNGPDGGVRAGIARLLPWAALTRAQLSRRWQARPEEVWERWAGKATQWPDGAAGAGARID
jgi:N-acetylglucosaminyl-diphospho-decaprenol L-rhamnosyltransferase